jgi:hypothetical protein
VFFKNIFSTFPAIIFAFVYIYKNKKDFEAQFVIACYMILIFAMWIAAPRLLIRFMYPFTGVLAVFAAVEMSKTYDMVFPKFMVSNKRKIAEIVVIIGIVSLLAIAAVIHCQ